MTCSCLVGNKAIVGKGKGRVNDITRREIAMRSKRDEEISNYFKDSVVRH